MPARGYYLAEDNKSVIMATFHDCHGMLMSSKKNTAVAPKSKLSCRTYGKMTEWLAEVGGSLAITTYSSGKLVLVTSVEGRLYFQTRHFARPMGLAVANGQLALAVRKEILLFGSKQSNPEVFLLRKKFATGRVDTHDVQFGKRGVYFANTRFNCVARTSQEKRFIHCWQPAFIDGLVQGDRCHLNGLGMCDGQPAMVTAFCATGHAGGWREQNRFTAGVLIDIKQDTVVVDGLCMPHSPRWHEGRWWFCNSGLGLLSAYDPNSQTCEEVCALPGFSRGLNFVGDYALVGLSRIRRKHILDAPPVRQQHEKIYTGVSLVNWKTGQQLGGLEFLNGGREVYDVAFLPGVQRPRFVDRFNPALS